MLFRAANFPPNFLFPPVQSIQCWFNKSEEAINRYKYRKCQSPEYQRKRRALPFFFFFRQRGWLKELEKLIMHITLILALLWSYWPTIQQIKNITEYLKVLCLHNCRVKYLFNRTQSTRFTFSSRGQRGGTGFQFSHSCMEPLPQSKSEDDILPSNIKEGNIDAFQKKEYLFKFAIDIWYSKVLYIISSKNYIGYELYAVVRGHIPNYHFAAFNCWRKGLFPLKLIK